MYYLDRIKNRMLSMFTMIIKSVFNSVVNQMIYNKIKNLLYICYFTKIIIFGKNIELIKIYDIEFKYFLFLRVEVWNMSKRSGKSFV